MIKPIYWQTNIALAIEKEPKVIDKIEVIWLGGHSLLQDNNDEFNFNLEENWTNITRIIYPFVIIFNIK